MTARNSITGDSIKTKTSYGESATNWDKGWEILQQGNCLEEEPKHLPEASDKDFLLWLAVDYYEKTKGYKGQWNYIISQYEKDTETTPDKDLLYFITKGE